MNSQPPEIRLQAKSCSLLRDFLTVNSIIHYLKTVDWQLEPLSQNNPLCFHVTTVVTCHLDFPYHLSPFSLLQSWNLVAWGTYTSPPCPLLNTRNIIDQNDFKMHQYKILTSSSGLNGFPLPPTPPDILNPSSGSLSILTRI